MKRDLDMPLEWVPLCAVFMLPLKDREEHVDTSVTYVKVSNPNRDTKPDRVYGLNLKTGQLTDFDEKLKVHFARDVIVGILSTLQYTL